MNRLFYKCFFLVVISIFSNHIYADNNEKGTGIDSLDQNYLNWFNLDYKNDKVLGVSTDKAYAELLVNKKPKKTIVVAVIDGGIDINHEDLQGKIWVNEGEIPGNDIDDDHNGYINDINGWNFLGNISGENVGYENLEYVRVVRDYRQKFDSIENEGMLDSADIEKYRLYKTCSKKYESELSNYLRSYKHVSFYKRKLDSLFIQLKAFISTENPSRKEIKSISPGSPWEKDAKKKLLKLYKFGLTPKIVEDWKEYIDEQLDYYVNIDLNARSIIGDDPNDLNDSFYGNSEVNGSFAEHGTFVAGIIAANRNNNLGINGIAENVKIMALRTVPNGDENDKDVALSIKYAVDNGANIINMSFGKDYSPNKAMVDDAIQYAEEKGVFLVHASGNDSYNLDTIPGYPNPELRDGSIVKNWLTVGASSKKAGKELAGMFSSFGKNSVDLFAPGVDIISLYPNNTYNQANGTSFSSPVVAGVAALVWSYYPELTLNELREILVKSTTPFTKKVYEPNPGRVKKHKVSFSDLSVTGGIVNAYRALELAAKKVAN